MAAYSIIGFYVNCEGSTYNFLFMLVDLLKLNGEIGTFKNHKNILLQKTVLLA